MTSLRERADAAAQVLVDDVAAPALDDRDAHHLLRVLRLRDGERVVAFDGAGAWRMCAIAAGTLEPTAGIVHEDAVAAPVAVWLPALKGDRAEWAVQKLTELGVDEIGLLTCERATARLSAEAAGRVLARWRRVAREAACQSRRVRLPVLTGPLDVPSAAGTGARRCDLEGTADLSGSRALAVGPEGGWSDAERAAPGSCVGLADTVLRTETAAVVAGAVLIAARRTSRHDAVREAQ